MHTTQTPTEMIERARVQARRELALGLRDALLNPLAALLGALQVLQAIPMSPEQSCATVAEAERDARRIVDVVNNVGAVSRAPVIEIGPLHVADVTGACGTARGADARRSGGDE